MYRIFFVIIICISALGCLSKRTDENSSDRETDSLDKKEATSELGANSFEKRGITSDNCSFCTIDGFLVEPLSWDIKTRIVIDFPVAIELLDRIELIGKYHEKNYDTLMKLLKMKHRGDRNEIYRLTDLSGYYRQGIKPVLEVNDVTIIDTIKHEQFITIKDKGKKYIIDLASCRKDDGVLMFKPGKRPIYWTMKRDEENCYDYFGFAEWYYNCP